MVPLVSVVIPCYKGSRFLAQAIESCLNQTYRDLEVIVVDDASPENDAEIAESYQARDCRVRVLRHAKNGGVSRAYNTGFAAARGELFTRLSQDDVYREDAFEIMVRHLQAAPEEVGLVYCDMQKVDESGRYLSTWYQSPDPENALFPIGQVGMCVMWRRAVYETVGPFRPVFDLIEDYEFQLRVSRRFRLAKCGDEAPFFFRCHPDQNSNVKARKQDVVYALAQLSHVCVLAKQHPTSLRYWKGVGGGISRVVVWTLRNRWENLMMWEKPRQI
jgi:glycosyltransferase involved in cell wall biosynthesis